MFGTKPPELPDLEPRQPLAKAKILTPAIVQRGIVWGGLGAGAWAIFLDTASQSISSTEVLGVGILTYFIAVGILLLLDKP